MSRFFCRNRSWSTCSGESVLHCAVTTICCNTSTRDALIMLCQLGQQQEGSPPADGVLVGDSGGGPPNISSALASANRGKTLPLLNALHNRFTSADVLFGAGPSPRPLSVLSGLAGSSSSSFCSERAQKTVNKVPYLNSKFSVILCLFP